MRRASCFPASRSPPRRWKPARRTKPSPREPAPTPSRCCRQAITPSPPSSKDSPVWFSEKVRLNSGQRVTLDLKLEVGNMTESVTVQGERGPAVHRHRVGRRRRRVGADRQPADERPRAIEPDQAVGGRARPDEPGRQHPPLRQRRHVELFHGWRAEPHQRAAARRRTRTWRADRRISYNPPADIVQEIKIETFQSDASYGNSAAGTVNIVTKSGTNRFSGGAGFYTQPSSLSGTTFFTKRAGRDEPPFTYKQGGATAGGPVVIPGLIDGRNRLFWIVSYDNIRDSYVTPVIDHRAHRRDAQRRFLGAAPAR